MTAIRLQGLSKDLGDTRSVDDVSLDIAKGELFVFVGPSGCGKTTLLNLVAGLLQPTRGRIWFDDRDVTRLGTEKRNAVLCFQGYALWPHLSVQENVRFGLEVRGTDARERERAVHSALALVRMQEYAARRPAELSGGQQQRVAIARAIAAGPACLLLDEPLSNLDTNLRHHMREELRRICRAAGLTTLYVTHDQKEALSIADRLAVLKEGRLMQVGTPEELYRRPNSPFVAEFLGQANFIAGRVIERSVEPGDSPALLVLDTAYGRLHVPSSTLLSNVARVTVSIRPDQVQLLPASAHTQQANVRNLFPARVLASSFLGDSSEHRLEVGGSELRALSFPAQVGVPERVSVLLAPEELLAFSAEAER